jgi:hypothetical protein
MFQYKRMGRQQTSPAFVIGHRPDELADMTFAWWSWGPVRPDDGEILVSVTDFEISRASDLPRVYVEGLRLRRAWSSVSGTLGMWLWAKPLRRRSGSVSVWSSEEDLLRFIRWPRHVEIMRRYRHAGELTSASWRVERFDAAEIWSRAAGRLTGDDPELAHRRTPR